MLRLKAINSTLVLAWSKGQNFQPFLKHLKKTRYLPPKKVKKLILFRLELTPDQPHLFKDVSKLLKTFPYLRSFRLELDCRRHIGFSSEYNKLGCSVYKNCRINQLSLSIKSEVNLSQEFRRPFQKILKLRKIEKLNLQMDADLQSLFLGLFKKFSNHVSSLKLAGPHSKANFPNYSTKTMENLLSCIEIMHKLKVFHLKCSINEDEIQERTHWLILFQRLSAIEDLSLQIMDSSRCLESLTKGLDTKKHLTQANFLFSNPTISIEDFHKSLSRCSGLSSLVLTYSPNVVPSNFMYNNKFGVVLRETLQSLSKLKTLKMKLEHCSIYGAGLWEELGYIFNSELQLESISIVIHDAGISKSCIDNLVKYMNNQLSLREFDLQVFKVSGFDSTSISNIYQSLKGLNNINSLSLGFGFADPAPVGTLSDMGPLLVVLTNLKTIKIAINEYNKITSQELKLMFAGLDNLKKLESLTLDFNKWISLSSQHLKAILSNKKALKLLKSLSIDLSECLSLSNLDIIDLCTGIRSLKQLHALKLSFNYLTLGGIVLVYIGEMIESLRKLGCLELSFARMWGYSQALLVQVLTQHPILKYSPYVNILFDKVSM